jgi:DNA-binding LacI/PurR family transcriptional regulator
MNATDPTQPRRVALLLDHLESDYQSDIVAGVRRAARAARVRMVVIPGGWLGKPGGPRVVRNFVYDFLPGSFDGLLISAGSLSNQCGVDHFRSWLGRLGRLPCMCVGIDHPEIPNVHVDNEVGVHALVSHLIEKHGRRRIAFIRGPATSAEAAARLRAYERALAEHGLARDERLIVPGGLGREDGTAAVQELFDDRRFTPATLDGIVGVNDDVALGALEGLHRRGIAVPDPVAVAGFDDASNARSANPPLTTVNQRVELQAYTAALALIENLEKGGALGTTTLSPEPVIRLSCGCTIQISNDSRSVRPPLGGMARTCKTAIIERRTMLSAALSRAGTGRLSGMTGWEFRLLDSLVQELASGTGVFVREVEHMVRKNALLGRDPSACHDVLTALRLQVLECAALEPVIRPRVEDIFQEARFTVSAIGADVDRERQQTLELRLRFITQSCLSLFGKGKQSAWAEVLTEQLPALGIGSFSLTHLSQPKNAPLELTVLVRRSKDLRSPSPRNLPPNTFGLDAVLEQEDTLIVMPLEFDDQPIGMAAFGWGAHSLNLYERLRELLGAAVYALTRRE